MSYLYSKKRLLLGIGIVLGALLVLYLSWVSSPKIGNLKLIPFWMKTWIDTYDFMAIRTSIPLVVLGILAGFYLSFQKSKMYWWFMTWLLLSLLVIIAELGQYFRPKRSFDWYDIFWGSLGALVPLMLIYFMQNILIKKSSL